MVEKTESDYAKKLHEALWLFREFTIRNATQWELGCGHHHPIWAMLAELIGEQGGIVAGPHYRFIHPDNDKSLDELYFASEKVEPPRYKS
jgi:hypothetical protein